MIKTQLATLLFFILTFQAIAQTKGSSTVFEAEITYNDGTTAKGLLDGFIVRKAIFGGKGDPFANMERRFNLKDKKFTFKDDSEVVSELKSEEVKHVKLFKDNGEVLEFGRFSIKHLDKKGNLVEADSELWLPYLIKGRMSILGFSLFNKTGQYMGTITLFNREGDNYVVDPYNIKVLDMFSMQKMMKKIKAGLMEVFKGCPETVKLVKSNFEKAQMEKAKNKDLRKKFMKELKYFEKSIKKLSSSEKKDAQADFYGKYVYEGYLEYFEHYDANCPDN